MSFKNAVANDIHKVFLNLGEFAETRTIRYDGELYENIPVVLTGLKEQDRRKLSSGSVGRNRWSAMTDNVDGLYAERTVLHCALKDLGGNQPEKGAKFRIYDADRSFFKDYTVEASVSDMGMLRVELGRVTE